MTEKAVFLDRDGVLNRLIFNPDTGEFESPHKVEDLEVFPETGGALLKLQEKNFLLLLVSNQPSFAKGKTSLEEIKRIQARFHEKMLELGVRFSRYYYCYHHPNGIVPEFTGPCHCRKPGIKFLEEAREEFKIDFSSSWMVGDRNSDIICGKRAGLKTILILESEEKEKFCETPPDFSVSDLSEAVKIIIRS